jgi:metallo-beta-lactamase family protein
MKITFCGGARAVTGANYLIESGGTKILVDCGLNQGSNFSERHNWDPFPYDPADIAAVFVTHAHIDHTGRLPLLPKRGFKGKVYSTHPTREAAELLLADSDHVLSEEAKKFKLPLLFSNEDITLLMSCWEGREYHQKINVGPFTVTLQNSGHILGSAFYIIEAEGKTLVSSGDLGNSPAPLIAAPEDPPATATYSLIESAYGDRIHEDLESRRTILREMIRDTVRRGGALMIPAFAMERTQEILYEIHTLILQKEIPAIPVFLDSPLAIRLTNVYRTYDRYLTHGSAGRTKNDEEHLFQFPSLRMTLTTDESKSINDVPSPKVIIAGSGMSHGGRILHHERRYLPDERSTLLIIGYQAEGSLGRQILEGATSVRMFGEDVAVRCRIKAIGGYSAHADQSQLLAWAKPMAPHLKKMFVVQGEEKASETLAAKMKSDLGINAVVPRAGDEVVL